MQAVATRLASLLNATSRAIRSRAIDPRAAALTSSRMFRRGMPLVAGAGVLLGVFLPGGGTTVGAHRAPGTNAGLQPQAAAPVAPGPGIGPGPGLGLPGGLGLSLPAGVGGLTSSLSALVAGTSSCDQPAGFDSPYLGHTGSADGMGGDASNAAKTSDMGTEHAMGLQWTFVPVYWAKFEPNGPTSSGNDPAGAWKELDAAVELAHKDGLNPWVQIDVGGNAGGPPSWAGQRQSGKSAPVNMGALIDFTGKLVSRYMPGGSLATSQGWGSCFGIRVWEMDNEPGNYETDWVGQAGDYAEFVERGSKRIHSLDPKALVLAPAIGIGSADRSSSNPTYVDDVLAANHNGDFSPQYPQDGGTFAAGPYTDVVSFHNYELLDCGFHNPCTVTAAKDQVTSVFNDPRYLRQPGFDYTPRTQFWCTECNYDFGLPQDPAGVKADWVIQWMARAFADGVTRLTIMDASNSAAEQKAVATWIGVFHNNPYSLTDVTSALGYDPSQVRIFRWASPHDGHWIYVAWAANQGTSSYTVSLPVHTMEPFNIDSAGNQSLLHSAAGKVTITLAQGTPFSAPVFIVDGLPGAS